jgi:uncharacterized membrane protein YoaK (UPF0700 family)
MLTLNARTRRLAAALSFLAGYVDAVGYLTLGGFFVSFMSGNSTRLAVGVAERAPTALLALGLIAVFVSGVAAGTWIARSIPRPQGVVIGCVACLIGIAALMSAVSYPVASGYALAAAMGVENSAFVAEGGLPVGLTYMTGTLVKLGQEIGLIRSRENLWRWVPYATHWLTLVAGAVAGSVASNTLASAALWPACLGAAALAFSCRKAADASYDPSTIA